MRKIMHILIPLSIVMGFITFFLYIFGMVFDSVATILIAMVMYFVLILFGIFFMVYTIIDCVRKKFRNPNDKIMWILVICLFGFFGAVIYFYVHRLNAKKIKKNK